MTVLWIAVFFLIVMSSVVAAGYFLLVRQAEATGVGMPAPPAGESNPQPDKPSNETLGRALETIGGFVGSSSNDHLILRKLRAAGYSGPSALRTFHGVRGAAALALSTAAGAIAIAVRGDLSSAILPAIAGAACGYLAPARALARKIRDRQQRLKRGLPTALDLLALSLDAGQTLDQAILETSRGLERSSPELGAELVQVYLETRGSHDRTSALRDFALRTDEPEIRKVVSLLNDADRFGNTIVPALRNHARYLRQRMRQTAHEAARKVGVKLIFPIFFLIFPSVILITLGPACIMVFTELRGLLGS